MYYLRLDDFGEFKLKNIQRFVQGWSVYYKYRVKELDSKQLIDYFSELNIGSDLTKDNVRKLLRWKDPRHLTHIILSGDNEGSSNQRVDKVLSKLKILNQFRNSEIDEIEFKEKTSDLFSHGVIWKIFIMHICKPVTYPIADQHVFRSYDYHKKCKLEIGWKKYEKYKIYFDEMATLMSGTSDVLVDIRQLKDLDSALMVFGQFLNAYAIRR